MTYSRYLPVCCWTILITSFAKPHVPQESIQTDWKFYLKAVTTNLASRCDNRCTSRCEVTHFFNMVVFTTYNTNPRASLTHFSRRRIQQTSINTSSGSQPTFQTPRHAKDKVSMETDPPSHHCMGPFRPGKGWPNVVIKSLPKFSMSCLSTALN